MTEEEEAIDLGFDDDCYVMSCSKINMWFQRASKKLKNRSKKEEVNKKD